MQIADRFYLHQNLLETVQNVMKGTVPSNVRIPIEPTKSSAESSQTDTGSNKTSAPVEIVNMLDYAAWSAFKKIILMKLRRLQDIRSKNSHV